MKQERMFQLIGIALFLIVSSQTYAFVTPVKNTDVSIGKLTDGMSSSTTSTPAESGENSAITNVYRILTAIACGGIIAVLTMFLLKLFAIENREKQTNSRYYHR